MFLKNRPNLGIPHISEHQKTGLALLESWTEDIQILLPACCFSIIKTMAQTFMQLKICMLPLLRQYSSSSWLPTACCLWKYPFFKRNDEWNPSYINRIRLWCYCNELVHGQPTRYRVSTGIRTTDSRAWKVGKIRKHLRLKTQISFTSTK